MFTCSCHLWSTHNNKEWQCEIALSVNMNDCHQKFQYVIQWMPGQNIECNEWQYRNRSKNMLTWWQVKINMDSSRLFVSPITSGSIQAQIKHVHVCDCLGYSDMIIWHVYLAHTSLLLLQPLDLIKIGHSLTLPCSLVDNIPSLTLFHLGFE